MRNVFCGRCHVVNFQTGIADRVLLQLLHIDPVLFGSGPVDRYEDWLDADIDYGYDGVRERRMCGQHIHWHERIAAVD